MKLNIMCNEERVKNSEKRSIQNITAQSGGIVQTGGNLKAEHVVAAGGDVVITEASSPDEILKLLRDMQSEIARLELPDKEKNKAKRRIEDAIDEVKSEKPNKKSVAESLEEAGKILDNASKTAIKATVFGKMLSDALIWTGHTIGWL